MGKKVMPHCPLVPDCRALLMIHLSSVATKMVRGIVERRFCDVERDEEPNGKRR